MSFLPCRSRRSLLTILILFSGNVILCGCAGKRQERIGTGARYDPLALRPIPTGTDEERLLAEYKRVYTECANPQYVLANSTLALAQQARLAKDYSTAQQAFDEWLHFVTDTIAAQSSLTPGRHAAPEFRYDRKASNAEQAIKQFDTDVRDILRETPCQSSPLVDPIHANDLNDLGQRLVKRFSNLNFDNGYIAADKLLKEYEWATTF